jgi:hypothetical protein
MLRIRRLEYRPLFYPAFQHKFVYIQNHQPFCSYHSGRWLYILTSQLIVVLENERDDEYELSGKLSGPRSKVYEPSVLMF